MGFVQFVLILVVGGRSRLCRARSDMTGGAVCWEWGDDGRVMKQPPHHHLAAAAAAVNALDTPRSHILHSRCKWRVWGQPLLSTTYTGAHIYWGLTSLEWDKKYIFTCRLRERVTTHSTRWEEGVATAGVPIVSSIVIRFKERPSFFSSTKPPTNLCIALQCIVQRKRCDLSEGVMICCLFGIWAD